MMLVRKSMDRGKFQNEWLQSYHTFSFSDYYDPNFMGFSALRVINQDTVAPATGFGTHGHRDMEIISYLLKGRLEHKDSMGNIHEMKAGDFQVMSAGRGVTHSEYNPDQKSSCEFLQIWVLPNKNGHDPRYQQVQIAETNGLTTIVSGGSETPLLINQEARISVGKFEANENLKLDLNLQKSYWLQLIEGKIEVDGQELLPGDALGLKQTSELELSMKAKAHFLWFELP